MTDTVTKWLRVLVYICTSQVWFSAGQAHAMLMTFSDKHGPGNDVLIAFGNDSSYTFSHSLLADLDSDGSLWTGIYGFDPLLDTITEVSLALRFRDESDDAAVESVSFTFDSQEFGSQPISSGGAISVLSFGSGWDSILDDGLLNITLSNAGITNGQPGDRSDFLFLDSTLSVSATRGTEVRSQVPLPATLSLFGLGFAALLWVNLKPAQPPARISYPGFSARAR
jgi:hypothetical protein